MLPIKRWQASVRRPRWQGVRRRYWLGCSANRDPECSLCCESARRSLDRVTRVVSVKVYLATDGDFYNQPIVADAASALEQAGVDVIAASGFEAGGHRGSFLQPSEDSLTGTMALVPQVVDAVRLPVVAAGGIGDAHGVVAAFALGAEGVQMGTAFLACKESGANTLHREALLSGQVKQTALTRGFTGRLSRGIKNRLLDELNQKDIEVLPYPLQRALVRPLSIPAETAGRSELLPLWAGQSANLLWCTDVRALLDTLVKEISEIGGAVQNWNAHRWLGNAQD